MQSPLNSKIMYVFWDFPPLYQQITSIISTQNCSNTTPTPETPCHISAPCYISNLQKCTKNKLHYNHSIILYYYSMFCYPGIFTFSITAVFSPGRGCVQLTRQLKKSTYPFHPISLRLIPYSTHQSTH